MPHEAHLERFRGYLAQRSRIGPESVHIDLANACNLACVTCWNHAQDLAEPKPAAWKAQVMAPDLFHRLVDELAKAGVARVVLGGGGEPFTHPEIHAFIAHVKTRGLRLTVLSNGTLCDWTRLRELQVDQFLLNLAAATPATYAAGHPGQGTGTFERLMAGVREVRGATAVNFVQVIHGLNCAELPEMVRLAHAEGVRVSFKVGDVPRGTERHALTPEQRQEVRARLLPEARMLARQLGVKHNLEAFAAQFGPATPDAGRPECFAGYFYSRVYVDGRVFFCCDHIEAGRLEDGPFDRIWRGAPYAAVRARLHRGEGYPGCARCGKHDLNFGATRELRTLLDAGILP